MIQVAVIIDERWSIRLDLTEDEYCELTEVAPEGPRLRRGLRLTIEEEGGTRVVTGDRCRLVLL